MIELFATKTIGTYVCLVNMFHKSLSILLVFVILSSGFTKLFIYAGYNLNKDYIAKTLCENKEKPSMHCNGKCYLTKKLKEAEQSDQKNEQSSIKRFIVDAFLNINEPFKFFNKQEGICSTEIVILHSLLNENCIFHPPKQAIYAHS